MTAGWRPTLARRLHLGIWAAQATVIGLVGIFLLALVFASPTESFCSDHKTGCGLITGFVSTTLVAIAGYFFVVVWSLRKALPGYRNVVKHTPERLLPAAGRIRLDDIITRPQLADTIINELEPSRMAAPVLVVGAAGTGKTTFLLELASRLADTHVMPVLCVLRGTEPPLRLRDMARTQFIDAIDPLVRSQEHAERVWRRLCGAGEVVLLADGLDEFMPGASTHDRDQAIRQALAAARNERLPVVLTSRPDTVPVGAYVSTFELDPLPEADTIRFLEDRIPARSREDPGALHELAELGRQSPYYLDVIAGLLRARSTPRAPSRSREERVVGLLDDWVDLIIEGRLVREVELDESSRRTIIDGLGAIAHVMTTRCALQVPLADLAAAPAMGDMDPSEVVDGATRLGLLETFSTERSSGVRFTHAISQAYFHSRLLRDTPEIWRDLLQHQPSAEMRSALVMWSAQERHAERTEVMRDAIINRARELDADRALLLLVTAAEIASVSARGGFTALDDPRLWQRASPRAQLAAIRRLQGRTDTSTLMTLMERTRDKTHYRVRWSAAQALAATGQRTWDALGPEFAHTVAAANTRSRVDWIDEQLRDENHDIAVACWILPALVPRLTDPAQSEATELVKRLAALVPHMPAGTEASLAQGFKLDAFINPTSPLHASVLDLLGRADFWYSRINLAHAACIRAITDTTQADETVERLSELCRSDRHPFAAAAAGLCVRALHAGTWTRFVWYDEIAVITRSGSVLDDDAARLVADMILLLNLTEQGDPAEDAARERRKEDIYRRPGLPWCLSDSRKRDEIFSGCPADRCAFNICPYPATADRALARNEFSEAFCRHQSDIAGRRLSLRRRLFAPKWTGWSRMVGNDAVEFWQRMQNRVS